MNAGLREASLAALHQVSRAHVAYGRVTAGSTGSGAPRASPGLGAKASTDVMHHTLQLPWLVPLSAQSRDMHNSAQCLITPLSAPCSFNSRRSASRPHFKPVCQCSTIHSARTTHESGAMMLPRSHEPSHDAAACRRRAQGKVSHQQLHSWNPFMQQSVKEPKARSQATTYRLEVEGTQALQSP